MNSKAEPVTPVETKRNIFSPRVNLKPYEYPSLLKYVDGIRGSYWTHKEYNYTPDVQDMKVYLEPEEKEAVRRAMMAISQIEVAVKSFWAKIGDHLPKPEIMKVGATYAECHVEGTQVLTGEGWVDFKDIAEGDQLYQYNPDSQTLELVDIERYICEEYSGKMYNLQKNYSQQAIVTPNHRIGYFDLNNEFQVTDAEELSPSNSNNSLPESAPCIGGSVDELSVEDRIKIAIQADGTLRHWRNSEGEKILRGKETGGKVYEIKLSKPRKVERLKELLDECSDKFTYDLVEIPSRKDGYYNFTIKTKDNFQEDYKAFDWVFLGDKTQEWCKAFITELCFWDGSWLEGKEDTPYKYYSTEKSCIDKAQAVGVLAGYRTLISKYKDNRKDSYKDQYTLSFTANRSAVPFGQSFSKEEIEEYNGNVYCVTVPSGFLITRFNGKTFISGNSEARHEDAYSELLEVLGLNNEFDKIKEIPALWDRISYIRKINLKARESDDPKDYFKSIIFFSMLIEYVSLFSQFYIILALNKNKNVLKGMSNAVEATSKEETLHSEFGFDLINIIKEENPEWWTPELVEYIKLKMRKAYVAEEKVLDWIYELGDFEAAPKEVVQNFIKARINRALVSIDIEPIYDITDEQKNEFQWFEDEIIVTKSNDFFQKRPTSYSKKNMSITAEDLF